MQTKKRKPLKSQLEQFVEANPEELRWLWYYEFSRQIELDPDKSGEQENFFRQSLGSRDWHLFKASLQQVPDWPKLSYIEIPANKRAQYRKLWNPLSSGVRDALKLLPQLTFAQSWYPRMFPSWLLTQLMDGVDRNGWPGFRWQCGEPVDILLIQLPRSASVTELKNAFGALLDTYPRLPVPTQYRSRKRTGPASEPQQMKYHLKALEAYRKPKDRAALFPNSRQLENALRKVREILKHFPLTNPPPKWEPNTATLRFN